MGRITLIVLSLFLLPWAYAQNCNFQFNQNQINVNYNGGAVEAYFYIDAQRPNNSSPSALCDNVAFFFSTGYANSYQRKAYKGGQGIGYTLEKINPTGTLKAFGDHSGSNEYLVSPIQINGSIRLTGLFKMPAQALPAGEGHYQDVVNVTVYGTNGNNNFRQGMTKQLVINIQAQSYMELSIVPVGSPHNSTSTSALLDFGELTQGKQLSADLMVKSNIGYRVRVSSNQNGNFKHATQSAVIPYEFSFAGNVINLATSQGNPVSVTTTSTASAASGDRYNMGVKVGNPTGKPIGNYSDYITVSIQSN